MADTTPPPESGKSMTKYMVLFAPQPEMGDPLKWRELGWYNAHSERAAKIAARDDEESGFYGQLLDIAAGPGLRLRAVAQRSWPDNEEAEEVFTTERQWSSKPLAEIRKEAE